MAAGTGFSSYIYSGFMYMCVGHVQWDTMVLYAIKGCGLWALLEGAGMLGC